MARETLPLLAHLPRLEADGVTHRRDCECVRCDAGFRPTEHERTAARLRFEAAQSRELAARALARRRERARLRRAGVPLAEALASVESLAWAQQGSNLRPED